METESFIDKGILPNVSENYQNLPNSNSLTIETSNIVPASFSISEKN